MFSEGRAGDQMVYICPVLHRTWSLIRQSLSALDTPMMKGYHVRFPCVCVGSSSRWCMTFFCRHVHHRSNSRKAMRFLSRARTRTRTRTRTRSSWHHLSSHSRVSRQLLLALSMYLELSLAHAAKLVAHNYRLADEIVH